MWTDNFGNVLTVSLHMQQWFCIVHFEIAPHQLLVVPSSSFSSPLCCCCSLCKYSQQFAHHDGIATNKIRGLSSLISLIIRSFILLLTCLSNVTSNSSSPGLNMKSFLTTVQGCRPCLDGAY